MQLKHFKYHFIMPRRIKTFVILCSLGLICTFTRLYSKINPSHKIPINVSPTEMGGDSSNISTVHGQSTKRIAEDKTVNGSAINSTVALASVKSSPSNDAVYAVVFGYPRTGSTFTGELFNQNPDALYMYEPFITKQRLMDHPRPLNNSRFNRYVTQTWECFFTCNFTCLFQLITVNKDIVSKSNFFKTTKQCMFIIGKNNRQCIEKIEDICKQKTLRVFKTVRSTMECAEHILSQKTIKPEQFRLIHLTRDPRASYQSRLAVNAVKASKVKPYNHGVCARMRKDVIIKNQLAQLYPSSFLDLHYENLAHNPLYWARSVYQFIKETDPPEVVEKWLKKSTSAPRALEKRWETVRRNSSQTAEAWKNKMPNSMKREIDSVCLEFYNISKHYKPIV